MEICPKCGEKFPHPKVTGGYATLTIFRGGALDTKIRCPGCDHVYDPRAGRSLGLKVLVGLLVVIAVAMTIYVLALQSQLK